MIRPRGKHYWRNLGLFTLLAVLLMGSAGAIYLAHWRAMALVHPPRSRPSATPADWHIPHWEEVRFRSADGLELAGWFIPPDPASDGATVIFLHGLGNHRGELLEQAAVLAGHGYGALLFDLRNHGESQGTLTTLGYYEVEDVRGAVAYLLGRSEVAPERIGLLGMSLGAATGIRAAARIPEIKAVVAQSAFATLQDNVADGVRAFTGLPPFPFAPLVIWFGEREAGIRMRDVRPLDDVSRISPRPILLIHGEQDSAIPPINSQRLYDAAGEPKELYLIPNAGHGGFLDADRRAFEEKVVGFLNRYLRGEPVSQGNGSSASEGG